ncbi:NADP-dependent oxidoreductase [Pseudoclavibacter helvolus]|uniref:NADP-dependent oxidoreductase n=1 Tax=Pseudoclavibacter helvolus TaxID=255205 RepID=UPI0037357AF3
MTDAPDLQPTSDTMRAALLTGLGGPEMMQLGETAIPLTLNSDTLVRVKAAGVNPIDGKTRSGAGASKAISSFPSTLGGEFSGVVVRASYELAPFQPGDEVYGMLLFPRYSGAYAEYVSVPFMSLAKKPKNLSFIEAGGVPLAVLTAWAAVVEAGGVYTGQRVLIHAGAGGVGHFAVQLASYYGAHVITTASERNHEWLRELGADQVIDYRNERFEDVITEPVDVVIDLIGNVKDATGTRSLRVLRDGGTLINVPTGSYPELFEEAAAENRDIVASTLKLSPEGRILQTITQLFEQGALQTHVDRVFPLAEAGAAQELIAEGHVRGKVVLDIDA